MSATAKSGTAMTSERWGTAGTRGEPGGRPTPRGRWAGMVAALACGGAALLEPRLARADEPPITDVATARKQFAEAEQDEQAEKWAEGVKKLRRIVAFKETAGVRFHLALCEDHAGLLIEATSDYQRAFDLSRSMRDADGRDVHERSGKALVDLLHRTPQVTVTMAPGTPAATISIDGAVARSATERPFPHNPGPLVVEATAAGRTPFRREIALVEGARTTVAVTLPALPKLEEAKVAPGPVAPSPEPAPLEAPPSRIPGYAFGGVALAGLAGGAVLLWQHRQLSKENDDLCGRPDVICDPQRDQTASTRQTLGFVSAGVGVAAGALSVYFLTRGPSSVALGPTGVRYQATF
jgi:hypothetical protein